MSIPFHLSDEERQRIRDAVAGLTGDERRRAYARERSRLLRLNPEYRAADNARQAERERARYHAKPEEARRKAAEKQRRYRQADPEAARLKSREKARRARLANPEAARIKSREKARRYRERLKARGEACAPADATS